MQHNTYDFQLRAFNNSTMDFSTPGQAQFSGSSRAFSTSTMDLNTPAPAQFSYKISTCNFCGKTFSNARNCQRHVRIHTGERPYKCVYCDKSFNQEGTRKAHKRIHTGETPFTCSLCNKGYRQRTHLRRHMVEKHGILL